MAYGSAWRTGVLRAGVIAATLALPGCGSDNEGLAPPEPLSACTGDWQTIAQVYGHGSSLWYRDGSLYYEPVSHFSTAYTPILAQPVAGGPPSEVVQMPPSNFGSAFLSADMWVEGDSIVYTQGDQENQFYSLPVAGVSPQLLADLGSARPGDGFAQLHELSPTDLFWTEESSPGSGLMTILTVPRSGGTAQVIGTTNSLMDNSLIVGIAVSGGDLLAASDEGTAHALPISPANPAGVRALASPKTDPSYPFQQFTGIDATGVLWTVLRPGGRQSGLTSIAFSPADGSPARILWAGVPARSSIDRLWPDGAGGWIGVGSELFDQGFRSIIWSIDARGNGRRLSCAPDANLILSFSSRPAITSDAVYFFAWRTANAIGDSTLTIERVAR